VTLARLWEDPELAQDELPAPLRDFYDGGLALPPRCVYANFVETLDGIVSIPELEGSNALVADGSADDKALMGLLRAFAELRARLGKTERAPVAIVTSGASLDVDHPVLADGAIVLTTARGAERIAGVAADVVAVGDGDLVDLRAALAVLRARGHEQVLAEAGPTTFGELVAGGLVDELFLTVSPVLAGRAASQHRLGLVEGVELLPGARVAGRLLSLRRGGEHLFVRYGIAS
jgi:riboflavin biosynthesis pyrimidine reductase